MARAPQLAHQALSVGTPGESPSQAVTCTEGAGTEEMAPFLASVPVTSAGSWAASRLVPCVMFMGGVLKFLLRGPPLFCSLLPPPGPLHLW